MVPVRHMREFMRSVKYSYVILPEFENQLRYIIRYSRGWYPKIL